MNIAYIHGLSLSLLYDNKQSSLSIGPFLNNQ